MPVYIRPPHCTPFAAGYLDGFEGGDDGPVTKHQIPDGDAVRAAKEWARGFSAGSHAREKKRRPLYVRRPVTVR